MASRTRIEREVGTASRLDAGRQAVPPAWAAALLVSAATRACAERDGVAACACSTSVASGDSVRALMAFADRALAGLAHGCLPPAGDTD